MTKGIKLSVFVILWCLRPQKISVEFAVADTSHHRISRQTLHSQPALPSENATGFDVDSHIVAETAEWLEKALKTLLKSAVRSLTPQVVSSSDHPQISSNCLRSLMKYVHDLTETKVWALKMMDSTSKIPSGLMEGTLGDFGSFDQCLGIIVPHKNETENFRGMYCAIEVSPHLPPMPKNLSTSVEYRVEPDDTVSSWYLKGSSIFYYMKSRLALCLPSSCTVDDVKNLVPNVVKSRFKVDIKKCYIDEEIKWLPIHIIVLFILAVLATFSLVGTFLENCMENYPSEGAWQILTAFSLSSNWKKLMVTTQTNRELRVLHGIRFLSLAWVILSHTYLWVGTLIASHPLNVVSWFKRFDYGIITNGWLAVDVFFLLSGLLTCYTGFFVMEKTKGSINIPLFMLYRYLRLTPSLMLAMGLIFFLPVISSGPFYDVYVDREIEGCRKNWWANLVYVSNWIPIDQVCMHPMWYLSADFQLFIVALIVLMIMYRSPIFGLLTLGLLILCCNILLGVLTYLYELPPNILLTSGSKEQVLKTANIIHTKIYTHVGPYFVGVAVGYLILKKKDIQLLKWQNVLGWCLSITLCVCSVYGIYKWNTGYVYDPVGSSLFSAFHRTTFSLGVAWVIYACVTGYGGPVNWILSSSVWIPLSRLTYMFYLLHGLVMWTRGGTIRERQYASQYNFISGYFTTFVFLIPLSVVFYLLAEAPFSRLLRMFFEKVAASKMKDKIENFTQKEITAPTDSQPNNEGNPTITELTAVKKPHPN